MYRKLLTVHALGIALTLTACNNGDPQPTPTPVNGLPSAAYSPPNPGIPSQPNGPSPTFDWRPESSNSDRFFKAVWGIAGTVLIGGQDNNVLTSPGNGSWATFKVHGDDQLGIWGSSAGDVYMVGDNGIIQHSKGDGIWTVVPSGTSSSLYSVWGSGANDVWAVGDGATCLHLTDGAFAKVQLPTSSDLRAIWGTNGDIYIAGSNGTLLYSSDGRTWTLEAVGGVTGQLRAIWGTSPSDVYVVGEDGVILHTAGNNVWTKERSNTGDHLGGVWGSSSTDVYAVGDSGTILHEVNGLWYSEGSSTQTDHLKAVWGTSATDIYAVGEHGTVLHKHL
jgi:hypothetical protein